MRYRQLSPSGDFTFGQGNTEFLAGTPAAGQAVQTRLQLPLGTFWRDVSDGLPLLQSIISTSGSQANLQAVDDIISARILTTQNISGINSFTSTFNPITRKYGYSTNVQTAFSTTLIEGTL